MDMDNDLGGIFDPRSQMAAAFQAQAQAQQYQIDQMEQMEMDLHQTQSITAQAAAAAAADPSASATMMMAPLTMAALPQHHPAILHSRPVSAASSRRPSAAAPPQQQQSAFAGDISMAGMDQQHHQQQQEQEQQRQFEEYHQSAFDAAFNSTAALTGMGGMAGLDAMGGMAGMAGMGSMDGMVDEAMGGLEDMTTAQAQAQMDHGFPSSMQLASQQDAFTMDAELEQQTTVMRRPSLFPATVESTGTIPATAKRQSLSMAPPPLPSNVPSSRGSSSMTTATLHTLSSNSTSTQTTPVTKSPVGAIFPEKPPANSQKPDSLVDPYSSSGFNFLELLKKVVNRPNPQVDIGAVDMSCSFVVTDARKYDNPIVYVSPTFEILTGYMKWEIRGRNCRFLQGPDGNVEKGEKRHYVDEQTVFYFKSQLERGREAQATLLNYRKNGVPFVNLLTMIPIEADGVKAAFFVGFQIDLVDHPDAIERRNADGSCSTNYRYQPSIPFDMGSGYGRRPMIQSAVSNNHHSTTNLLRSTQPLKNKQITEYWDKALLENTDSVVFVLSLKGVIQYVSPSLRRVLGFHPDEWVNTNISKYCHPSDIVPFTRDLRETSSEKQVDVIFRIRQKDTGYVWFESFGALSAEPGKGKKCIFFSGHRIPTYFLPANLINISSVSDNELWYKISPTAILLNMSSKSKQLLDHESTELCGKSLTDLVRPDKASDIKQMLLKLRSQAMDPKQPRFQEVRHDMLHKRGHYLQCMTTFYIGEEKLDRPPTYFIAETKFLKSHGRGATAQRRQQEERERQMAARQAALQQQQQQQQLVQGPGGEMQMVVRSPVYLATQLPNSSSFRYAPSTALSLLGTEDDLFEQLKVTRSSSWQFELRNMQKENKKLAEQVTQLLAARKKRKRRRLDKEKECVNCHTKSTPEWRRGPSGQRDLCNSCGLRFAKTMPRQSRTVTSKSQTDEPTEPNPTSETPKETSTSASDNTPVSADSTGTNQSENTV